MNKRNEYLKNYRRTNEAYRKKCNESNLKWWKNHPEKIQQRKEKHLELKTIVIKHYSNNKMSCECCSENILAFLTIDHINNDGSLDRKKIGSTFKFYQYLINSNFPKPFQVLCHNCNW